MKKEEGEPDALVIISNLYTLILRAGYLEIYDTSEKTVEQHTIPDMLFTPDEVRHVKAFLQEWILPEN